MKLVSPSTAFSVLVRLIVAAALIAVIAVGAPLHSHDLGFGDDDGGSPKKASCAACVASSSPGLVSEHADIAPRFQPLDLVRSAESNVVVFAPSKRSGRAPPAA